METIDALFESFRDLVMRHSPGDVEWELDELLIGGEHGVYDESGLHARRELRLSIRRLTDADA